MVGVDRPVTASERATRQAGDVRDFVREKDLRGFSEDFVSSEAPRLAPGGGGVFSAAQGEERRTLRDSRKSTWKVASGPSFSVTTSAAFSAWGCL